MRPTSRWWIALALLAAVAVAWPAFAGEPAATSGMESTTKEISLWRMIGAGGVIGYTVILISLIAVALVVEHFFSICRSRLVPDGLANHLEGLLNESRYQEAQDACAADGSFLGKVIGAGLNQIGSTFGFFDMQTAMQEASEREVSRLYRKLEYLSLIAVISPMMGLLGTVLGMISAFNMIAATEGAAKPAQLAAGIWEALVTTVMGLVVAIPTMFFVAFFRNRIDSFVAEAETTVERLMSRFRKSAAA
jgi:biopolymer transport protein ExbB